MEKNFSSSVPNAEKQLCKNQILTSPTFHEEKSSDVVRVRWRTFNRAGFHLLPIALGSLPRSEPYRRCGVSGLPSCQPWEESHQTIVEKFGNAGQGREGLGIDAKKKMKWGKGRLQCTPS